MRHFFYLYFPLWTSLSALCFVIFASNSSDLGFRDNTYGDFMGWIVFSFITLINAVVTFSSRWCYLALKHYPWLTLLLALLLYAQTKVEFDIAVPVIVVHVIFFLLGSWEIWATWKYRRLSKP